MDKDGGVFLEVNAKCGILRGMARGNDDDQRDNPDLPFTELDFVAARLIQRPQRQRYSQL